MKRHSILANKTFIECLKSSFSDLFKFSEETSADNYQEHSIQQEGSNNLQIAGKPLSSMEKLLLVSLMQKYTNLDLIWLPQFPVCDKEHVNERIIA